MSDLPRIAVLGPFTYRITTSAGDWAQSQRADPSRDYGYTDHERGVILVHEATTASMRRVVLLHELMHAAAFAGGILDSRKRKEEDWVAATAPMLLDALRRSPELSRYLLAIESPSSGKEAPRIETEKRILG